MAGNVLRRVRVEGFTSFGDASVDLGPITVLIGANGAGKSNLIRALELLGRIVDEDLRVHVRRNGGASALLNVAWPEEHANLELDWVSGGGAGSGYMAILAEDSDDLFQIDEVVKFQMSSDTWRWSEPLGAGNRETRLHQVIEHGGAEMEDSRREAPVTERMVSAEVVGLLRGCRVFHFDDTSADAPVKRGTSTADNLSLRQDAANLAAVLATLRNSDDPAHVAAYRRIVGAVQLVAPFFRDFVLEPENTDRIRLRWRDTESDAVFSAHQMSDGTLRFVCLATLLLQPNLPALVVLDEPELGLHPYAIVQLAGLLRRASTRSQVVLATQSVTLMNQFELAELVVVERGEEGSVFTRPDPEALRDWLQEYSLGELWEKNVLGGRPGPADG